MQCLRIRITMISKNENVGAREGSGQCYPFRSRFDIERIYDLSRRNGTRSKFMTLEDHESHEPGSDAAVRSGEGIARVSKRIVTNQYGAV